MNPPHVLDQQAIMSRIPHRHENLLLDSLDLEDDFKGTFHLLISPEDKLGRDIFYTSFSDSTTMLITPFLMEIAALASIVSSGIVEEGNVALFAGISQFSSDGLFPLNSPITGHVKRLNFKANFSRFSVSIESRSGATASANMMAWYASKKDTSNPETSKRLTIPTSNILSPITPPSYKDPRLFVVDDLCYISPDSRTFMCHYQYPTDHPFIKGHFPDNPIMMGVMQWMMLEDACVAFFSQSPSDHSDHFTFSCDADIVKADGTVVCEVKQATLSLDFHSDVNMYSATILSTKKVFFRDIVHPGDDISILITRQS